MKFKFSVNTNYIGSKYEEIIEIDDEELAGMSPEEIDDYVADEYFSIWLQANCDMNFCEVQDE